MQPEDADWAKQDPGGVFFNTALLDRDRRSLKNI